MARPLRVEYPGAYYHVINRGNSRENIFKSQRDKEKFLHYLGKTAERFSLVIHTYCLMSNHYHLLVETPQPNLSVTMQWLNVSYAAYFNRKRRRNGHLFQGRFKAILIDADEYRKELSRYVHLNPVRAKIVSTPAQYAWSSYRAFIGKVKAPEFLQAEWLLSNFGGGRKEAKESYRDFVEGVTLTTVENPGKHVAAGFILGDTDFVNWVKETFLSLREDEREIPQLKKLKPKVPLKTIVQAVCQEFDCTEEQVQMKGRKKNKAREIAIYLARDLTGLSCKELGTYFDGVSGALISIMCNRIAGESARNKKLKGRIEKIKREIFNI